MSSRKEERLKRKEEIERQKAAEAESEDKDDDEPEEEPEEEIEEEVEEKPDEKKKSIGTRVKLVDGSLRNRTIHTAFGIFKVDKDGYATGPNVGRLAEVHKVIKS